MERVIGLVVNDASAVGAFASRHAQTLAITEGVGRGRWGVGFLGNGDLLVKKAPISDRFDVTGVLSEVRARHVVLVARSDAQAFEPDEAQPLRYRDWLFVATGIASLPEGFVDAVQAAMPDTAFADKRGASRDEALQMLFMRALGRASVRDARELTTVNVRRALVDATERLREIVGDAPRPELAVVLHSDGYLFGLALGRALHVASFEGLETAPRRRGPRSAGTYDHLRAVVLTDAPPDGAGGMSSLGAWAGVEIGGDCEVTPFEL